MNAERSFHHQRRPPDVEEALSSMLWTPYDRTCTDSSSDEDDQRIRTERIHRLHNNYDHRITNQPLPSTYFDDDCQMDLTVAVTTLTPTNVANSLQSTPSVPFSNVINSKSNNNSDDASCSRSRWDPVKLNSNHKQPGSGSFRFSYPYYGAIPGFNKWWLPSVSSKEPPSYESLYANGPTAKGCDAIFKVYKAEKNTIKEDPLTKNETFSSQKKRSLQPLGQHDVEFARSLSSSSENAALCPENEFHIELETCYNNNIEDVANQESNGVGAIATERINETPPTKGGSKQTKEYNNVINNNTSNERNDNDISMSLKRIEQYNPQMRLQLASSQSNAATRVINKAITGVTDKSVKETEIVETISCNGEEVSEPVSCIDNSKASLTASNLRTSIVNNHNNNSNNQIAHIVPNTISMSSDAFPNYDSIAPTMNPLSNLFDSSWSDKATSTESAYDRRWESMYNEHHSVPTVVDAAIIQSSTCSLNGHVGACKSRSAFVILQSYSHLWKKTVKGVRTKAKRATRSSSATIHVPPNVAPLDTLTPNKCLAELERLYAEFWASESALVPARVNVNGISTSGQRSQQRFSSPTPSDSEDDSGSNSDYGCELRKANSNDTVHITDPPTKKMRLNIPAETNRSLGSSSAKIQAQQMNNVKTLPTNSTTSVFLTSSDCAAMQCLTSVDNRPKGNSVSDDDRCSNLLHETKNNYSDCVSNVDNRKINHNNNNIQHDNDDDAGIVQNDCMMSNNNESITMMVTPTGMNRKLSSVTIQVNSDNSDQNNNSNGINNKNNSHCNNINNYCEDNDCVGVEGHLVNLNISRQQKNNFVKSNGVSVVNCNYSSIYTINNNNTSNNNGVCGSSATTTNPATTTPVGSINVNKSVSQVSPVPIVICNGKTSENSDNIVGVHVVKNGSNGNEISNVHVTDNVNIINLSAQPQASDSTSPSVLSRSQKSAPVDVSDKSRTFASTECQTDEILSVQLLSERAPVSPISQRAQRRRDRRERRHLQQQISSSYPHPHHLHMTSPLRHSVPSGSVPLTSIGALHIQPNTYRTSGSTATTMPAAMSALLRPMLPDLLHRHFPPPYSALPLNGCGTSAVTSPASPPMVGSVPPPGTTILPPMISTVPMPAGAPPVITDGRFTLPLPIIRRSPSERSGKGCCGQWFAGPPLRALIAVVALGGIACALGGAALGATGLAGPPSSHFTAALLMLGVGVVLVAVSGAAWRMTAPGGPPCLGLGSSVDRCSRRPCGRGGGTVHGLLYPEFQHRPPPPSYQASMQEYRLRLLLLDRDRQNGVVRGNSPPPTYRSYVGSLLRAPLATAIRRVGTTSSVAGTSEYSLPPSYISRNTTPATISSERSIEIPSSDSLLPNEDFPESSIRELFPKNNTGSILLTQPEHASISASKSCRQIRTSAIVEIESTNSRENQSHSKNENETGRSGSSKDSNPASYKDLVTIVTISKTDSQENIDRATRGEHIEILAHL